MGSSGLGAGRKSPDAGGVSGVGFASCPPDGGGVSAGSTKNGFGSRVVSRHMVALACVRYAVPYIATMNPRYSGKELELLERQSLIAVGSTSGV